MSGEIKFDLPLWGVSVYHNTPETDGVWNRTFNSPAGDEEAAIRKVKELFTADGFNWVRIIRIELFPLMPIGEGGEDDGIGSLT